MTYLRQAKIQFLPASTTGLVQVVVNCVQCDIINSFFVTKEELARYERGALIQEAFPNTPKEMRELLISGICPVCWDKLFKEEEEE